MDQLLSLSQAAEQTATTVSFWRKLIYRRRIPIVKLGKLTRLRAEDVERLIRDGYRSAHKAEEGR